MRPTAPVKASRLTNAKVGRRVIATRVGPSRTPMWFAAKITAPELGTYCEPCTLTRHESCSQRRTSGRVSRRPHSLGAGNRSVWGRSGLTPGITRVSHGPDRDERTDCLDHLFQAEGGGIDHVDSGRRRFEVGDCGIIAVAADHLIGHGIDVDLVLGELGMPPGYSRGRIGNQQHAYVG